MKHNFQIGDCLQNKINGYYYKVICVKETSIEVFVTAKSENGIDCTNWYGVDRLRDFVKVDIVEVKSKKLKLWIDKYMFSEKASSFMKREVF